MHLYMFGHDRDPGQKYVAEGRGGGLFHAGILFVIRFLIFLIFKDRSEARRLGKEWQY